MARLIDDGHGTGGGGQVALRLSLRDVIEEYEAKRAKLPETIAAFDRALSIAKTDTAIGGTYGGDVFGRSSPNIYPQTAENVLLRSAWRHVHDGLNVARIASAADKDRIAKVLEAPPAFTIENIRETFGDYILRPRYHILRGLAEVFGNLDPAYKSHSKVRIGVKGLPKRVILSSVGGWGSYGGERLRNMISALCAYRGEPLPEWSEIAALIEGARGGEDGTYKDLTLRRFQNGNGHLFFGERSLLDINRALAEFYGEVLPDTPDEDGDRARPRATGTAVSKDLQFYPTPQKVIDDLLSDLPSIKGLEALEPSCGDGRMMLALRKLGAKVTGIEVDRDRAAQARAHGLAVLCRNFLEYTPDPSFDLVVMNPPFYGTHYAKHVTHAARFLKSGGRLLAILPITARTDHGLLSHAWAKQNGMKISTYHGRDGFRDLPVGSFSESGTNINTTVFQAFKE